jgi:hypothetical protein
VVDVALSLAKVADPGIRKDLAAAFYDDYPHSRKQANHMAKNFGRQRN